MLDLLILTALWMTSTAAIIAALLLYLDSRPLPVVIAGNGVIDQVVDAIAQIAAQMHTAQTVTVPLRIIQAHPPSEP